MHQIVASLTDDSRGIIYNHDIFIIQVTGLDWLRMTNTLAYYGTEVVVTVKNLYDTGPKLGSKVAHKL